MLKMRSSCLSIQPVVSVITARSTEYARLTTAESNECARSNRENAQIALLRLGGLLRLAHVCKSRTVVRRSMFQPADEMWWSSGDMEVLQIILEVKNDTQAIMLSAVILCDYNLAWC